VVRDRPLSLIEAFGSGNQQQAQRHRIGTYDAAMGGEGQNDEQGHAVGAAMNDVRTLFQNLAGQLEARLQLLEFQTATNNNVQNTRLGRAFRKLENQQAGTKLVMWRWATTADPNDRKDSIDRWMDENFDNFGRDYRPTEIFSPINREGHPSATTILNFFSPGAARVFLEQFLAHPITWGPDGETKIAIRRQNTCFKQTIEDDIYEKFHTIDQSQYENRVFIDHRRNQITSGDVIIAGYNQETDRVEWAAGIGQAEPDGEW
jgi:hypothetical protein